MLAAERPERRPVRQACACSTGRAHEAVAGAQPLGGPSAALCSGSSRETEMTRPRAGPGRHAMLTSSGRAVLPSHGRDSRDSGANREFMSLRCSLGAVPGSCLS